MTSKMHFTVTLTLLVCVCIAACVIACSSPSSEGGPLIWDPEVEMSATLPYVVDAEVPGAVELYGNPGPIRLELASADPSLLAGYDQLSQNELGKPLDPEGRLVPHDPGSAVIVTPCCEIDYLEHTVTLRPWIVQAPLDGEVTSAKEVFVSIPVEVGTWTLRIESAPTPEQGGLVTRKYKFTPATSVGRLMDGPPGETIFKEFTFEVLPADAAP